MKQQDLDYSFLSAAQKAAAIREAEEEKEREKKDQEHEERLMRIEGLLSAICIILTILFVGLLEGM